MNRPQWSDAPTWAQWLTQGADGLFHWYEQKPGNYAGRVTIAKHPANLERVLMLAERRPVVSQTRLLWSTGK